MADWKDNKGVGPWPFTEQSNKWGYLNNPRWSSQQNAIDFCEKIGLPLDSSDQHKPCGHWHKPIPKGDECSLEPFFDWPESVPSESFICYSGGKIFILQRIYNNGKVYVYDIDGNPITDFSTIGTSPACMQCLAVDNSYCFVGAISNVIGPITYAHIARFSHSGSYQTHWKVGIGAFGSRVQGVFSDGDYVYVTSRYGLHKYTRSGALMWEFPYRGLGVGEFWTAYGLWSDKTYVFVTDYSYHKILKYLCSDGSFIFESSDMIPASPSDIIVDDKYAYVPKGWGVCVFHRDTLEYICCPIFDDNAYDPGNVLGGMAYDGKYWWGLDGNIDKVVKFDIYVVDESIPGDEFSIVSGEPQIWLMPDDEAPKPAGTIPPLDPGGIPCIGRTSKLSQSLISVSVIEGSNAVNRNIRVIDNCGNSLAFQVKEVNSNNYITWISSPIVGNSGVGALNINFSTISLSARSYTGNIVISTGLGNLTLSITLVVTSSPAHGEASGITLIEGDTYRRFNFRAGEIKLFKFKADSGPSSPTMTVVAEAMSHYSHGYLHIMARYAGQNWESPPPNDSDYAAIKAFIVGDPMKFKGIYNDIYYYLSLHLSKRININHDPQVTNGCWYTWIKNIGSIKLNDCMIHFRSWG